jgi:branched-chain amino acid transport system substrate-binding protein
VLTRSTGAINKIFSAVISAGLILTVLAACGQQATTNNSQTSTQPIVIGASIPTSGDYSADGLPTRQGYELWASEINKQGGLLGRQIKLDLVSDNSGDASITTAYRKLINDDHVDIAAGPFGDGAVAAARIANQSGMPLVDGTGTSPSDFTQGLTNMFSVSLSAGNIMRSFAEYILSLPIAIRPKTAVYMGNDDIFFGPQVQDAENLLEAGGVKTLIAFKDGKYPDETTDYTPDVQKAVNAHADVVVLGTDTPDAIAFTKGFKQQHYNPKAVIFASGPDQGTQFTQPIGGTNVAEGLFVPNGGWDPTFKTYQNASFLKDYVAMFGGNVGDISSDTVQTYSVLQVLQQAITKVGKLDNAAIMNELRSDTFNTLQGPVKFAKDGENSTAVASLFQWQKGTLIAVYPQNNAAASPEYPKNPWP